MPNQALLDINLNYLFTQPNLFKIPEEKRSINNLIFHHTAFLDAQTAIDIYKQYGVSTHYLIDEDGNIFQLVKDENIAYHAGASNWKGIEGLNQYSIGIEFLSSDPYKKGFSTKQIEKAILLSKYLMCKYEIKPSNILAHSDIGYDRNTGYLNRKQDPSYLFPWEKFASKGIGLYPQICDEDLKDKIIFKLDDNNKEIKKLREKLKAIGYKIQTDKNEYDEELARVMRCFNRHYNPQLFKNDPDYPELEDFIPILKGNAYQFHLSSQKRIEALLKLDNHYF
jgi:N-acetylmuramoyl-L-alanine amidase